MSDKKYFVVFDDRCGRAVPDATAQADVEARILAWNEGPRDKHVTDIIGNDVLLACYRLAVLNGDLAIEEVKFFHDEKPLVIDYHGKLSTEENPGRWPQGLADVNGELLRQLLFRPNRALSTKQDQVSETDATS